MMIHHDFLFFFFLNLLASSSVYILLHYKTKISLKYLCQDNLAVILVSSSAARLLQVFFHIDFRCALIFDLLLVLFMMIGLATARFYRVPIRKTTAQENDIVSPADGNIIYIKKIEAHHSPFSIKNNRVSQLEELTKTPLSLTPAWLVGINMTLFDVHKNCAPISGEVLLNKHSPGKFLSLKDGTSIIENERNTMVFKNQKMTAAIVQIASKRVRRIKTYVLQGEIVERGQWIGMITLGSQVDLIFPAHYELTVQVKDQVYAGKTIIAREAVK